MIEIIPAIDLIAGKAVRLRQGDFRRKTVYGENPVEIARQFEASGLRRLHLVDLDGAKTGKISNLTVLEQIAKNTNLQIDFGGGVKFAEDLQAIFDAGAKFVSLGSVAVRQAERLSQWLEKFGAEKIILGADAREEKIAINGWKTQTNIDLFDFLQTWLSRGVRQIFVTDISRDGLLQGSATELYRKIKSRFPAIYLIASGGVSQIKDLAELETVGCAAAIVGKAIYENKISQAQIKRLTAAQINRTTVG
jgi:phosphoribosylformimino-5-aminoimidazole carboxamide ribotide isomerase